MEIREIKIYFVVLLLISIVFVFYPSKVKAYKAKTTHNGLTSKIIEYYNKHHTEELISDDNKKIIIQGSIDEDNDPWLRKGRVRYLRHFYDPVNKDGLGSNDSAKEWVIHQSSSDEEEREKFKDDDFSWTRAVYEYKHNKRDVAFKSLGHVLHLIEDMSVPAHTRDDEHPFEEPYEEWAKNAWGKNVIVSNNLINKIEAPSCNKIEDCFDDLAKYTNKTFFSKDTIVDKKYKNPNYSELDLVRVGEYVYGVMPNDKNNYLIRLEFDKRGKAVPKIKNDDDLIMNSHWNNLAPRAVMTGNKIIELFFEEVKPKKTKTFIKKSKEKIVEIKDDINNFPKKVKIKIAKKIDEKTEEVGKEIEKKVEEKSEGLVDSCVAQAAYASTNNEDLAVLREFRDEKLLTNRIGAEFAKEYYRTSPPIATYLSKHERIRKLVRSLFFEPIVNLLR